MKYAAIEAMTTSAKITHVMNTKSSLIDHVHHELSLPSSSVRRGGGACKLSDGEGEGNGIHNN
jgi:hypothetical protein